MRNLTHSMAIDFAFHTMLLAVALQAVLVETIAEAVLLAVAFVLQDSSKC